MLLNINYDYNRAFIESKYIEQISTIKNIPITEAIALYLKSPELEEHIYKDDYNTIQQEEYLNSLIQKYIK